MATCLFQHVFITDIFRKLIQVFGIADTHPCFHISPFFIFKFQMSATTFDEAVALVKNITNKPSDEEMLAIYGLFKQATVVR